MQYYHSPQLTFALNENCLDLDKLSILLALCKHSLFSLPPFREVTHSKVRTMVPCLIALTNHRDTLHLRQHAFEPLATHYNCQTITDTSVQYTNIGLPIDYQDPHTTQPTNVYIKHINTK